MAYWIGLAFVVVGLALAWSGYRHRQVSLQEEERLRRIHSASPADALHPSLSMLADFAPSLTVFGLGAMALMLTVAFFAVNALKWVSLFDLAGLYVLVAGYGYWMFMKTRHRSVETLQALAKKL